MVTKYMIVMYISTQENKETKLIGKLYLEIVQNLYIIVI